jgi:Rieske Fe-S protein
MQRRNFIRSSCTSCLLVATGWMLPALSGCGPAAYQVFNSTEEKEDRIEVPADTFAKGPLVLVRPKGWLYSIALRKHEDNTYSALLLKCTHQDNQLTAASDGYSCSLHGSAYNKEGRVTKGPAERALKTFSVTTNANQLFIHTKA